MALQGPGPGPKGGCGRTGRYAWTTHSSPFGASGARSAVQAPLTGVRPWQLAGYRVLPPPLYPPGTIPRHRTPADATTDHGQHGAQTAVSGGL